MKFVYKLSIGIFLVLTLFIPQIVDFIYPLEGWWFTRTEFSKDNLLGFYGSYITFLGTVSLGALALWQNKMLGARNQELQTEIIKQKSLEYTPIIVLDGDSEGRVRISYNCISGQSENILLKIYIKNITNTIVKNVNIKDVLLETPYGQYCLCHIVSECYTNIAHYGKKVFEVELHYNDRTSENIEILKKDHDDTINSLSVTFEMKNMYDILFEEKITCCYLSEYIKSRHSCEPLVSFPYGWSYEPIINNFEINEVWNSERNQPNV